MHEGNSIKPATHTRPLLLVIAYLGFISLGLPDTLIGVAWPSVRDSFGLQQSAVALVFFGAGISYFLSSFFTGRLLGALGIGLLLAGSSALVALSGFGYAVAPMWLAFAACSALHGLGSGAIDAGLNHYVAHHFSARHMSWLHACYTLGATLGPLIMTGVIAWHGQWRAGYFTVASMLLLLAVLFAGTHRRWNDGDGGDEEKPAAASVSMGEAMRQPVVRLQVLIFFIYTGLEMTAGQWSFTLLTEARGVSRETAGLWVTTFWGSLFAGRVLFGFVSEQFGLDRLVRSSMSAAVLGAVLLAWNPAGWSAVVALAIIGLGLASIYPCLMTRTAQRLGPAVAAHAIGFQVSAAILGGAALPSVTGFLAQRVGLEVVAGATLAMAVVLWGLHEVLVRRQGAGAPSPGVS